ncbi:histidine phosphatase family protein [Bradyrhizobium sp. 2TAF24]|uniref:histidine phosphatase family protein n=1 Tax=Bradyrhizobium sp. 2TAF24 TaxID=3233011 RepID=UPI003F920056
MPGPIIYYIRHGQTAWNAAGRFQGSQDIPLNDIGRGQAVQSGRILGRLLSRDARAAAELPYVASPLGRARQTMELLRATLELPPETYAIDPRLREIAYGRWEGATLPEMQASDPEIFASRQIDKWGVPPPGGESYAAVTERMRDWHASLTADTVVVAHGGTARALMVALGTETPESAPEIAIEQGVVYVFADGACSKHG